jgi:uncharacterized membrane protein YciS (DUF1049 family)
MRVIYLLFLVAFTGAAAVLAYENQQEVSLSFFNKEIITSVPVLVGLTYLAGMLSGWTVVGLVRRSLHRVLERPFPGEYARTR